MTLRPKPTCNGQSPPDRDCVAYVHGRDAYHEGATLEDNPVLTGVDRVAWFAGWLDERMKFSKAGRVLAEYRVEWP